MDTIPDITHGQDNLVLPFQVDALDVRGRIVRLGSDFDAMVARHNYPPAVTSLLGELAALAMLLGSVLKFDGKLILQAQTNGPVRLLVADVATPDRIRAMARFDAECLADTMAVGKTAMADLLGEGQLVMTIDQGADMARYQGIVALHGQSLSEAADEYFRQSEQIPTRVRLAVGSEMADGGATHWRAGGILLQYLPSLGGAASEAMKDDAREHQADEAWAEARALVETVEPVELLDRLLPPERLLYRLFHERGVRVFDPMAVKAHCTCNRERIADVIRSFTPEEREHMVEDGRITVTCDYCSTAYGFDPQDFAARP